MRKLLLSLCLLPSLALANPPAQGDAAPAHDMPMQGGMHHHGHQAFTKMLDKLNLSDKQRDELKALVKTHHADIGTKMKAIHEAAKDIRRLSFSNDYSDDKVQPLLDKAAALHREMGLQKAKLDNAIFKLLTAEQQKQLQSELGK